MEKYHILDLIGEGSFGRVYKGRKKFSGQVVAMKFIPKVGRSEKELRNLRREIEIMRELHHPNIIEMLDSFETDKEVVAVTDYAEGELFQILEDDGNLPEEQVQSIACQLVSALYYLHSHRILHRDMKPQNILLGKGGVVKLCDFGFARAMSINTLVLTSIKGTPLYMSPELVEEKPYDHTADLWALGCILYELFTGQPPFYTNSIFQLVSLIIKDPVRWPKNMSPPFKEFLQGLLTKNPRNRLSWPMLLEHPFVAHGVTVNEKDKLLASPFTRAPTASLIIERDKQAKEKTQPAGTSKILSKAREKADKENKKKQAEKQASRIEAWGKEPGEKQPLPVHPDRPHTRQWEHAGASQVQPTPRPDRISQDYANEYPSIEVESRTVLNKPEKKNIENVKLNEEEADSDDEWQGLVETSDPETDPDMALTLMKDAAFVAKLKSRLQSSSVQVLDGILEGASRLRPVLRVITNMFAYKGEEGAVGQFASSVDCPGHLLTLIQEMLQKNTVKQQPWCQQILLDLVATISAFTASDILSAKDPSGQQVYVDTCVKFGSMMEKLLNQKFDKDLRLREQTLMCTIFLCETMEKMALSVPDRVFSGISQHRESIEAVLHGCLLDEELLKQMEEVAEGNSEAAQQRIEDLVCLSVACLAALTHLPVQEIHGTDGKRQIATVLGGVLSDAKQQSVTEDYLLLINHPSTCANVLKALYSSCQECISLCRYLGDSHRHMVAILGVLQGKVELADMECNSVMEMVLQLLNTIIVQTKQIPQDVADISPFIVGIFLESQLASHTAAAALLFSQMLYLGVTVDVPHEELMNAALSEFTDLAQICVRCPLDFGVLDGIVLLLYQVVAQGDVPIASMYIECGIWNMLWHRLAQMLKVRNLVATGDLPQIIDMETDGEETQNISMPDWNMLSFQGLLGVLQLAVAVFTKFPSCKNNTFHWAWLETFQVMSSLANSDGILTLTLMHLMSRDFLDIISNRSEFDKQKHTINTTLVPCFEMKPDGGDPAIEVTMQVTQLCCFPFAIDANEDLLATIQESFYRSELLPRLLWASQSYLRPEQLELPVGLMSRLVLSDGEFVLQFAGAVKQNKAHGFLRTAMRSDQPSMSVLCDTISVCSHLARTTPDHLILLMDIFKGDKNEYKLLETLLNHDNAVVRSRICSLLGNCMKHSNIFYAVLHQRAPVMQGLIAKLRDEDANVKKGASYAIGNAGYHSSELYSKLKPAIPFLIKLLDDPIAKTRANAASALGNMALHSADLAAALIQEKAIQSVLEVACHDSQYGVQECALTALRSMVNQDKLKQELKRLKALEKLTNMTDPSHTTTPRPRSSLMTSKSLGRRSITTVMQHCAKLVRLLGN